MTRRLTNIFLMVIITLMMSEHQLSAESLYSLSKKGQEAYDAGDYQKAQDYFIKAQLDDPDNPVVYYNLGNAQYKNKDYDSALNHYKQALNTDDKSLKHKAHFNMGNAYFRKNDYDKSLSEYEDALKIDPNDEDAKKNIAFVKKVKEEMQKQQNQNKDGENKDQDNKDKDQDKSKQNQDQNNSDPDKKQNQDGNKDNQGQNQKKDEQEGAQDNKDDSGKDKNSGQSDQPQPESDQDKQAGMKQAGADDQKTPDDQEMKQAERVLNRLKDQPGQALIPSYDKRQVDKDW